MHRVINNTPLGFDTDHVNGDGLDNRKINLRTCSKSENKANSRKYIGGTNKYKGVSWSKGKQKWASYASKNSKIFHLGYFISEVEAALVYNKFAKENYGEFARLNKV